MDLILYSKPGCHLCEGLQQKLEQVTQFEINLEIRDITTQEDWFSAYQYEIPVLYWASDTGLQPVPRLSPRGSVVQLERLLERMLQTSNGKAAQ